jgi:hypothetical protein
MRVVIEHSAHFDWDPVPPDVKVTEQDIAAGRVKPAARGSGHTMAVLRQVPSHTTVSIAERDVVQKIIHAMLPQNGARAISRKDAVAKLLAENVLPQHSFPRYLTKIIVEDDGPDEATFDREVGPVVEAIHDQTGQPCIDPGAVAELKALYLEPADSTAHRRHLESRLLPKHLRPS